MLFPLPNTLFRVSSLAALGSTMMEGEDGAVVDLIKNEKVSLPVLIKSSTRIDLNHVCYMYIVKADANIGLA